MNTERVPQNCPSDRPIKRLLLGSICVFALGVALAPVPSMAQSLFWSPGFWSPAEPMYRSPTVPTYPHRLRRRIIRREAPRVTKDPFGNIPPGPLEAFISIEQQKLHLYSDGVHITDVPVATGVPGHLTPLGIFSVIQRDRYHHSNIYSNAPMPFMERITWSGVALHEGPGVGHQASHGCIRMPHDFAAKLWMLPTMGMRVIISHSELKPLDFADPHLFVHKDKPPTPTASAAPIVETAQKVDPLTRTDFIDPPAGAPAAAPQSTGTSTNSVQNSGQADGKAGAAPAVGQQPKTDSATAAGADSKQQALTAGQVPSQAQNQTQSQVQGQTQTQVQGQTQTQVQGQTQTQAQGQTQSQASPLTLAHIVNGAAVDAAATSKAAAQAAPLTTAQPATTGSASSNPATLGAVLPAAADQTTATVPQPEPAKTASDAGKGGTNQNAATSSAAVPAQTAPTASPVHSEADAASGPNGLTAPIGLGDVPLPLPKPAQVAEGGAAPIAIFISRKESRIYVRQNFTPVFDAPIKIDDPTQPLGTHVFTAMDYMPDHSTFHWTVVTMPTDSPRTVAHWRYVRDSQGWLRRVRVLERIKQPAQDTVPETPQQALARIQIPQDVINQISQLIVPGSSLIVSDQGLGPETGRGTDFIVVTR